MNKQNEWLNYALSKIYTSEKEQLKMEKKIDSVLAALIEKGYKVEFGVVNPKESLIIHDLMHYVTIDTDILVQAPKKHTLDFIEHKFNEIRKKCRTGDY